MIRARERGAALRVGEIRGRTGWMGLREEWNSLADAAKAQVFLRHEFITTWLDNFAAGESWRTWTVRDVDGVLHGALPMVQRCTVFLGIPVTELAGAANVHSCRFDLLCRPGLEQGVAEALDRRLAEERWDVLRLPDVPESGAARRLLDAARARGAPVGAWRSLQSPWFPLPGAPETLESTLDAHFRANCRRRRRKLSGRGELELQRVTGGRGLEGVLEEGFALEASGWKGRGGTAMAQDRSTRGFYTELARVAAERGWLSLYVLRLQGRAVAFHFGLVHDGRYLLLKPAYDERLGACSPGQLLVEDVARDGISRGWASFDFLGPDMPWKRDWTDRTLAHDWLYVFRDSALGRALAAAKFRLFPAVREVISRWQR